PADHALAADCWLRTPAPIDGWRCRFTFAARAGDLPALDQLAAEATEMGAAGLTAMAERAWRHAGGRRAPRRSDGILTPRELEVLQLVADGLTNKEIAARLHLSPRTVGVHLEHSFVKLVVATRSGAVQEAMRQGLLRPPS
ncbi:MAG: LuxR C-terminal-related transcriptional regulator, partial [Ilumatobacteraceae bacterium]